MVGFSCCFWWKMIWAGFFAYGWSLLLTGKAELSTATAAPKFGPIFAIAVPIADPRNRSDFRDKRQQCCIAIYGCDGKSLAICDFGLRFLGPKPLLSAGFLAIWLRQSGNR